MPNTSDNQLGSATNTRIVRVRDLPIYYDTKNDDIARYLPRVEDDSQKNAVNSNTNGWLYSTISQTRQSIQQIWHDNKELRERIVRGVETGEAHTRATIDYIRDDETLLPKVGVVTIAGLGGLLLGHKGGALRKTFYSSVAATVALSACYPKQTSNILDQVYLRMKTESKNLFESTPSIPAQVEKKVLEGKDQILRTVKNANEPVVHVKGDYGQGTQADQQFYTTRGTTDATVSPAEKTN